MSRKSWWWTLLVLAAWFFAAWQLQQQPHALTQAGLDAFRQGDFVAAKQRFEEAVAQQSSTRTLRNLALAALLAKDLDRATEIADRLASSGHADDLSWRDFLHGNISWRRSEMAEIEAHGPVPPAGALERAIAHAEAAQQAWQVAFETRGDWSAAQRNLQRVELRLQVLREEQQASAGNQTPDVEKMNGPPDLTAAPMDSQEQERLMQQLDRLDLQEAARKAQQKPDLGEGLEW